MVMPVSSAASGTAASTGASSGSIAPPAGLPQSGLRLAHEQQPSILIPRQHGDGGEQHEVVSDAVAQRTQIWEMPAIASVSARSRSPPSPLAGARSRVRLSASARDRRATRKNVAHDDS
jgi:hypothetical protein